MRLLLKNKMLILPSEYEAFFNSLNVNDVKLTRTQRRKLERNGKA
jgi:hypothetical protein